MTILVSVLFGVVALIAYGLADYWGPLASRKIGAFETSALARLVAVVLFLVIFLIFFITNIPTISAFIAGVLFATGIFMLIGIVAYYRGAKTGNIAILSVIANASSVITVGLGIIFLNNPLSPVESFCIIIIIIGTVLASFRLEDVKALRFNKTVAGAGYGILAMFGWGVGFFLTIIAVKQIGWFLPAFLISAIMLVYYGIYFRFSSIKYIKPKSTWMLLVLLGIVAVVGISAFNLGVTTGNPLIIAPIAAASPAVTVALALVRQKEKLEMNHAIGVIMIIAGLVLLAL